MAGAVGEGVSLRLLVFPEQTRLKEIDDRPPPLVCLHSHCRISGALQVFVGGGNRVPAEFPVDDNQRFAVVSHNVRRSVQQLSCPVLQRNFLFDVDGGTVGNDALREFVAAAADFPLFERQLIDAGRHGSGRPNVDPERDDLVQHGPFRRIRAFRVRQVLFQSGGGRQSARRSRLDGP